MKVSKVELIDYLQFKDLTLDLTYPKGHKKAGEPLDKICIIGQSGVGKTNLLEMIKLVSIQKSRFINNELDNFIENITFINRDKGTRYYYKANNSIDDSIWKKSRERIDNYNKERLEYIDKLSNKLRKKSIDYEGDNFIKDIEEWEEKNSNFLEKISDKLNEILIKFNLQLAKIDENQQSYNDLIFKDLSHDEIIKYDNLSTGTKNLLSTFIPLKIHNPKDSIILIDEPENSFYPDIQRMLTELYMEVGENNQLIMATHSPLIASSFEPWEVVELKFDKNNQIYREPYYPQEEENHIDNYTLDPRMLTWTSILTRIFDMKEDSNFDFREKKLMEYIRLENELHNIKDKKEKMQKFEELMKLSELLGLSDNEKD